MANKSFSAIILRVNYEKTGDTASIPILGKTMLEWIVLALSNAPYKAVQWDSNLAFSDIPSFIKDTVDFDTEYTAVLFSDTPLLTKKTILDAICALDESKKNVLRMTRGLIFKTAYLKNADKVYTEEVHYFDEEDFITAYSFKQITLISEILKSRILYHHMENGVQFEDSHSAFIGPDVVIGKRVIIGPNNIVRGETVIKDGAKLLQGNVIENSIIGEEVSLNCSQVYKSFIGKKTTVGPYAYIRPDTVIGEKCRIGDFVEIKSSKLGDGCKVSHLSYVGDCEMGKNCNIGCGVVFVNYDGKDKHKAKLGDNVFVGSNCNVIAPIEIGDGAFLAAGSTVNKTVESGALAIARARQMNKGQWNMNKYTMGKESKKHEN